MPVDYSTVTEVPGDRATHEQIARLFHRYRLAIEFCEDKDVRVKPWDTWRERQGELWEAIAQRNW
jgi:ribulose bisphosphate carboxylase small subunit